MDIFDSQTLIDCAKDRLVIRGFVDIYGLSLHLVTGYSIYSSPQLVWATSRQILKYGDILNDHIFLEVYNGEREGSLSDFAERILTIWEKMSPKFLSRKEAIVAKRRATEEVAIESGNLNYVDHKPVAALVLRRA